ncbi:MAG: Rhomboid family protein, partial [Frankiales bacterium]|nr:Rhomboid family protein [Frankiales bacterium]
IGINAVVFVLTTLTGTGALTGANPSSLFGKLALAPSRHCGQFVDGLCTSVANGVAQGEYFRLLTSTFLHFGIIHIALNMYCLYLLGPALEQALGRLRYCALYLLSGLSGAALSYAFGPVTELAAGASGAVFGLFAAFFVLQRKRGGDVTQIATTIGINLALSFAVSGIDWRGHVGGLIGGALVAGAVIYAPEGPRRSWYQLGGAIGTAVLIVLLVAARTAALT